MIVSVRIYSYRLPNVNCKDNRRSRCYYLWLLRSLLESRDERRAVARWQARRLRGCRRSKGVHPFILVHGGYSSSSRVDSSRRSAPFRDMTRRSGAISTSKMINASPQWRPPCGEECIVLSIIVLRRTPNNNRSATRTSRGRGCPAPARDRSEPDNIAGCPPTIFRDGL